MSQGRPRAGCGGRKSQRSKGKERRRMCSRRDGCCVWADDVVLMGGYGLDGRGGAGWVKRRAAGRGCGWGVPGRDGTRQPGAPAWDGGEGGCCVGGGGVPALASVVFSTVPRVSSASHDTLRAINKTSSDIYSDLLSGSRPSHRLAECACVSPTQGLCSAGCGWPRWCWPAKTLLAAVVVVVQLSPAAARGVAWPGEGAAACLATWGSHAGWGC